MSSERKDTKTLIITHKNADFDALSSMIAAKKLHPEGVLVYPSSQEKSLKNFLLNTVAYYYTFLKESEVDLEGVERLVIVDTRQKSRIGTFSKILDRVEVIIYDHHPPSSDDIKGDVEVVDEVGANTTLMVEELRKKDIPITPDEATIMLLGIYEDTGKFTFPSTTPRDLEAASYLLKKGGDINSISHFLSKELSFEQFQILSELVKNLRRHRVKGVEIGITEARWESYVLDVAVLAQMTMDMLDLEALFCLIQLKDRVFLVGRSRVPEVDVGEICERMGGGGHKVAASSSIKGMPLPQVRMKLLSLLEELVKPRKRVKDLMFSPVKTVKDSDPIEKVHEVMAKYGINAVPVVDKRDRLVGIITRHVVDRALYHNFGNAPCRSFMERDFVYARPEDEVESLEDVAFPKGQRFIPVVDNDGRVVGALTRTTLLSYYKDLYDLTIEYQHGRRERNLQTQLNERLPEHIVSFLKKLGSISQELGYRAYIVGGFVRDLILGRENYDIDVVVEGDGERLVKEVGSRTGYKITTYSRFKTGSIWLPQGERIDVATARMEYYEGPGKLPVVERSSLAQDLYRRDFTINTLAISVMPDDFGRLIDFFGGYRDIKDKVIRVLHNLSFVEDPTRILRALRFSAKLGFRIGKTTDYLLKDAVKRSFLKKVEGTRIYKELRLLIGEVEPLKAFDLLRRYKIIEKLFPGTPEKAWEMVSELAKVVSWSQLAYPKREIKLHVLFLLPFFGALSEEEFFNLLAFLKPPKDEEKLIKWVKENAARIAGEIYGAKRDIGFVPMSFLDERLKGIPYEAKLYIMALIRDQELRNQVRRFIEMGEDVKPRTTGRDLLEMGYKEGPIIGKILKALRKEVLDGRLKSKEEELEWVRRNFPIS